MKKISLRSIDVGFDLRTTGHRIARPAEIGWPGEVVTVLYDGGAVTGRACDCGSALRRAGFDVGADWFAGRADWGRPLHGINEADCAVFEAVSRLAEEDATTGQD